MKKSLIYLLIVLIIIGIIVFVVFNFIQNNNQNNHNQNPITGQKTSTNINEKNAENRIANIIQNASKETEISSFSTKILDDTPSRVNNINITCSTLNGTIVKNGETFSFNDSIGKPTAERGYQEAKIIIDHKAELGIGGGNCQVSSTLYDAVLSVPSLIVTERHEHGKDVGYVEKGKDATISYGSLDLKFRNDLGHDIRIEATTDNKTVTVKIIQLGD